MTARAARGSIKSCSCGKTLSSQNKSGKCRTCYVGWLNTDPEMVARRHAAQVEFFARPDVKERLRERARHFMANLPEHEIERRREAGKILFRQYLARPDVVAITAAPETRARAGRARTETVLGWCPPELRDEYRELKRRLGLTAAEARAALEPQIPGTEAHARLQVENRLIAGRIRNERQKAQAY